MRNEWKPLSWNTVIALAFILVLMVGLYLMMAEGGVS